MYMHSCSIASGKSCIYCENYTKPATTMCDKMESFLMLQQMPHTFTAAFETLDYIVIVTVINYFQ